jgi:hypothetical protein
MPGWHRWVALLCSRYYLLCWLLRRFSDASDYKTGLHEPGIMRLVLADIKTLLGPQRRTIKTSLVIQCSALAILHPTGLKGCQSKQIFSIPPPSRSRFMQPRPAAAAALRHFRRVLGVVRFAFLHRVSFILVAWWFELKTDFKASAP